MRTKILPAMFLITACSCNSPGGDTGARHGDDMGDVQKIGEKLGLKLPQGKISTATRRSIVPKEADPE